MRGLIVAVLMWLGPGLAMAGPIADETVDLLRIDAWMQIAREEGLDNARTLNEDMLNGQGGAIFAAQVDAIYDVTRMIEIARPTFEAMDADLLARINLYLGSDLGRRITDLELATRRAMLNPQTEDAARSAYATLNSSQDPRMIAVRRLERAGDLIERNVVAGMNDTLTFYRALAAEGGVEMSEDDILAEVYTQQDDLRAETQDWLGAYLLLLVSTMEPRDMQAYVAFYDTPEGDALTDAIFDSFGATYADLSHALGQVMALNIRQVGQGQSDL